MPPPTCAGLLIPLTLPQVLGLEDNRLCAWAEVMRLAHLPCLTKLYLGGNPLRELTYPTTLGGGGGGSSSSDCVGGSSDAAAGATASVTDVAVATVSAQGGPGAAFAKLEVCVGVYVCVCGGGGVGARRGVGAW